MTSEGNRALLPANVDRRPPLQRGLMNFQLQKFQLYNKLLKDCSLGKQLILFPVYSREKKLVSLGTSHRSLTAAPNFYIPENSPSQRKLKLGTKVMKAFCN